MRDGLHGQYPLRSTIFLNRYLKVGYYRGSARFDPIRLNWRERFQAVLNILSAFQLSLAVSVITAPHPTQLSDSVFSKHAQSSATDKKWLIIITIQSDQKVIFIIAVPDCDDC